MPQFNVIIRTPKASNVKHITADTAKMAAQIVAAECRKPAQIMVVGTLARATRFVDGSYEAYDQIGANVLKVLAKATRSAEKPKLDAQPSQQQIPHLVGKIMREAIGDLPDLESDVGGQYEICRGAARHIMNNPNDYTFKFALWLPQNWPVWIAFYNEARYRQNSKPDKPAGAKDIAEHLRWNRYMPKDHPQSYKVNNNYVAPMAWLYNAVTGRRYFRTRRKTENGHA